MRSAIRDYREKRLNLDGLVRRIEGISDAINVDSWRDQIFPIVLALEQVNASLIETRKELSAVDQSMIDAELKRLEAIINGYDGQLDLSGNHS